METFDRADYEEGATILTEENGRVSGGGGGSVHRGEAVTPRENFLETIRVAYDATDVEARVDALLARDREVSQDKHL